MGKNLKKVIFSVLLLAAVIIVSPKDAKAAGKVWMAGFNDNSITIQWTPQSLNGYRVDGYYLEKIGTQEMIWQGSADTTQVTVQATKGYAGYIRLGYRLTSLATGKTYDHRIGYTSHNLDGILMGQLEDLIMALQHAEMQERLAEAGMS